jgi:hypothetical protein
VSNEAINWAYRQQIKNSSMKFVLLALADMADEDHSCYPGQQKLADMTGSNVRTVRRHLKELEIGGYLRRLRRFDQFGHRTSDRYALLVGAEIPTGQNDRRSDQPAVNATRGQNDQRSDSTSLPGDFVTPTGQSDRVSLREPTKNPQKPARAISSVASSPDPRVDALCALLADRIEANGARRPTITAAWRTAARLMLERDGRTENQIRNMISWCQSDEFWRANILSMPKLREKYDQMKLRAKAPAHRPPDRASNAAVRNVPEAMA